MGWGKFKNSIENFAEQLLLASFIRDVVLQQWFPLLKSLGFPLLPMKD